MTGQLTIREMDISDIDSYCALFQGVFSNPPWNEKWDLRRINAGIRKTLRKKGFSGFVAFAPIEPKNISIPIGYITGFKLPFVKSFFFIDQLFVDGRSQGHGIGTGLFSAMTSSIKTAGVPHMVLLTKPKTPAENFYIRKGFRRIFSKFQLNGKGVFYRNS
jgi:GNAT superfamily N-acetyltransferase